MVQRRPWRRGVPEVVTAAAAGKPEPRTPADARAGTRLIFDISTALPPGRAADRYQDVRAALEWLGMREGARRGDPAADWTVRAYLCDVGVPAPAEAGPVVTPRRRLRLLRFRAGECAPGA